MPPPPPPSGSLHPSWLLHLLHLSGWPPSTLQSLTLQQTSLTSLCYSPGLSGFVEMRSLLVLNLSRNGLTSLVGLTPELLPSLQSLYASHNSIASFPPELEGFGGLEALDLRHNPCCLRYSYRRKVRSLKGLRELDGGVVPRGAGGDMNNEDDDDGDEYGGSSDDDSDDDSSGPSAPPITALDLSIALGPVLSGLEAARAAVDVVSSSVSSALSRPPPKVVADVGAQCDIVGDEAEELRGVWVVEEEGRVAAMKVEWDAERKGLRDEIARLQAAVAALEARKEKDDDAFKAVVSQLSESLRSLTDFKAGELEEEKRARAKEREEFEKERKVWGEVFERVRKEVGEVKRLGGGGGTGAETIID